MLLNGLRTLLVVLGLQGNGQDRDSDIRHHEGPTLPDQALQYEHNSVTKTSKGTTTNHQYRDLVPVSAPRGAFECSKKSSIVWWKARNDLYVFRSWQKDEVQVGVKRRTEWEEIYLSGRRHNLVMQVNKSRLKKLKQTFHASYDHYPHWRWSK